jgi:hypothetical protein
MEPADLHAEMADLLTRLAAFEARLGDRGVPHEVLTDFKAAVDDLRLRLWGLLAAGTADDARAFQQRFRVRRAREICEDLTEDLGHGTLRVEVGELHKLRSAARGLAQQVDDAPPGPVPHHREAS